MTLQAVLVRVLKCLALMLVSVLFTMEWEDDVKLGKDSGTTQGHTSGTQDGSSSNFSTSSEAGDLKTEQSYD